MNFCSVHRSVITLLVSLVAAANLVTPCAAQQRPTTFFDLSAQSIDGAPTSFNAYRGKVVLAVNTASRCGFTDQYTELEKLYETYQARGLVVLGFPSNDFANQEPGSNQEIKDFCKTRFGVTFPMFARAPVRGESKQAVYRYLTEQAGTDFTGEIGWNFEKFLIDRRGKVRARYGSFTNPESSRVIDQVEALLADESVSSAESNGGATEGK